MPRNCKPKKFESDSSDFEKQSSYCQRDSDDSNCKKSCSEKKSSKCREKNCSKCKKSSKNDAPQVNVYKSTSRPRQQIPSGNVNTLVSFDTALFDVGNNFILASSQFQPRIAGYYAVSATISMRPNGTDTNIITFIRKNNITSIAQSYSLDNTPLTDVALFITTTVPQLVYMNGTTDYLEVIMQQNTGAPLPLLNGQESTYFTAFLTKRFEILNCNEC